MERLCNHCQSDRKIYCEFALLAESIAADPNLDPVEKHAQITQARIEARSKACPQLNNIDPGYTGKELL